MLNSYSQNVKINAVTGAILKNHPKSWFRTFHLNSPLAKALLSEDGQKDDLYGKKGIIVLQMVICGDMQVMAELVYAKDYERREREENDR